MANIKIQNFAGQSWQTTIEQRAYLMLSSLSASVTNITIQFVELPADGAMPKRYRCSTSSPDLTNGNCQVSVEHPNGNSAIVAVNQILVAKIEFAIHHDWVGPDLAS